MIQRGDSVFKGYVQKQLRLIVRTMATKDDLYHMESRLRVEMATKDDLNKLTTLVVKIAEKVGVSM